MASSSIRSILKVRSGVAAGEMKSKKVTMSEDNEIFHVERVKLEFYQEPDLAHEEMDAVFNELNDFKKKEMRVHWKSYFNTEFFHDNKEEVKWRNQDLQLKNYYQWRRQDFELKLAADMNAHRIKMERLDQLCAGQGDCTSERGVTRSTHTA